MTHSYLWHYSMYKHYTCDMTHLTSRNNVCDMIVYNVCDMIVYNVCDMTHLTSSNNVCDMLMFVMCDLFVQLVCLCHTCEWVMSHTNGWVMSHTRPVRETGVFMLLKRVMWMSHVTQMNEPCHTGEWVMSVKSHTNESVMSHKWMSHVTHMNESHDTCVSVVWCYRWVMSHIWKYTSAAGRPSKFSGKQTNVK